MPTEAIPAITLSNDEFRELRATIRERGSLRHLTTLITFSVWGATMLWSASALGAPVFLLAPLIVLAAGFEVGLALHVGVERIGRYLQVRYEANSGTLVAWERTAMALKVPGGGIDPLFLRLYLVTLTVNLLFGVWVAAGLQSQAQDSAVLIELGVFGLFHVVTASRWLSAARYARTQRWRELSAFEAALGPERPPSN